jgi:hypothetical protein
VIRSEARGGLVWQQPGMISGPLRKGGKQLPCSAAKGGRDIWRVHNDSGLMRLRLRLLVLIDGVMLDQG